MPQKYAPLYWTTDLYENAFTPVPHGQRKPTTRVLIVTLGYTVALSCFVIGAKVGYALPFRQAVAACIAGNLILMAIGVLMGVMAHDSGWSTAFLARQMFGEKASRLVSVLIILLCIYWVGMNGDSFARMIVTVFPQWPVPVAVTAVILVFLWGLTAAYGWRGLELTAWLLTPLAVLLALSGAYILLFRGNHLQAIRQFIPSGDLTVTAAIAAVAGNYVFGCIVTPDLCRFAKSRRAVMQIVLPAHGVGFILMNLCGVLVAQAGRTENFSAGVAKLGLTMPFLFCSILGLWTTENFNVYCGSLAAQNLFLGTKLEGNLSHKIAAWSISGVAAAFASLRALNYLMPIITLIAVLVPPVAGMMCGEYFMLRRGCPPQKDGVSGWVWIPAWILGGFAGIGTYFENFLIPPVIAMLASGLAYVCLRLMRMYKTP